jgi:hypothetical protein
MAAIVVQKHIGSQASQTDAYLSANSEKTFLVFMCIIKSASIAALVDSYVVVLLPAPAS